MDVLSLIKQSLITDNSNPITKHFELGRQVASGGPEMVWKIFDATRIKDKTVSGFRSHEIRRPSSIWTRATDMHDRCCNSPGRVNNNDLSNRRILRSSNYYLSLSAASGFL